MGMKMLDEQCHRRSVLWVIKGLMYKGSQVQIQGCQFQIRSNKMKYEC